MDCSIKNTIECIAQTVLQDKYLCSYVTDPIEQVAQKNNQLSELDYLQCLQELSRIKEYRDNVLQVMDDIVKDTLNCIIFHGETQSYILQDKNPNEIRWLLQEKKEDLMGVKQFVSSKKLLPELTVSFGVYDAFMDMVDSLSVYPKNDFTKSWLRIVKYYVADSPFGEINELSNTADQKTISSLCACYKKIIEFEKEKRRKARNLPSCYY